MSDLEKKIVIPVEADASSANKTVGKLKKDISSQGVEIPVSIDLSEITKAIHTIEGMMGKMSKSFDGDIKLSGFKKSLDDIYDRLKSVIRLDSKGNGFININPNSLGLKDMKEHISIMAKGIESLNETKIDLESFNKLADVLENIESLINSIVKGMNFDNIRPSTRVQEDIDSTTKKLEQLAKTEERINKLESHFNKGGIKKAKQIIEWGDSNDVKSLDSFIQKIKEYISLGGDLSKITFKAVNPETQLKELYSFADVLEILEDEGKIDFIDESKITNDVSVVKTLRKEITELNKELEEAKIRENRDLNVSLDTKSVEDFAGAIAKAVEKIGEINFNIPENFTFDGLSVENLEKIIGKLDEVVESIKNISTLLSTGVDTSELKNIEVNVEPNVDANEFVKKIEEKLNNAVVEVKTKIDISDQMEDTKPELINNEAITGVTTKLQEEFQKISSNFGDDLLATIEDFKGEIVKSDNVNFSNLFSSLRDGLLDIVVQFQNSLNNVSFSPDQKNEIYNLLKQWKEASSILSRTRNTDAERAALLNQSTGKISNSYLFDKEENFHGLILNELNRLEAGVSGQIGEVYDTWLHSHPFQKVKEGLKAIGSNTGFSAADIELYKNKYLESGVSNMMVASNGKYTNINWDGISKEIIEQVIKLFKNSDIFDANGALIANKKNEIIGKDDSYNFDKQSELINSALVSAMKSAGIQDAESRLTSGNIEDLKTDMSTLHQEEQRAAEEAQELIEIFRKLGEVLNKFSGESFKFGISEESLDGVIGKLNEIVELLKTIGDSNISDGNLFENIEEGSQNINNKIKDAYNRMQSKSEWDKASISRTLEGLYPGNGESTRTVLSQLKNAHEAYDLSVNENWNWEEQYQWAVKFVSLYEQYGSRNDGTEKSLSKHTELYEKLLPLVGEYKQDLQAVLDFNPANSSGSNNVDDPNNPAKPLGEGEILVNPKVEDPVAFSNKVTEQLGNANVEINVEPKVENSVTFANKVTEQLGSVNAEISVEPKVENITEFVEKVSDKLKGQNAVINVEPNINLTSKNNGNVTDTEIAKQEKLQSEIKETISVENEFRNLLEKDFATKNKTEATKQLKQAFENYKPYYEDHDQTENISEAGAKAGYIYYKAFEEAVSKGIARSNLEKYSIDTDYYGRSQYIGKYNNNKSEDFDDLLSMYTSRMQTMSNIVDEIKSKFGEIDYNFNVFEGIGSYETVANEIIRYVGAVERLNDMKVYGGFSQEAIDNQLKWIDSLKENIMDMAAIAPKIDVQSFTEELNNPQKESKSLNPTIQVDLEADITSLNSSIQSKKDQITPVDINLSGDIASLNADIQSKKNQILPPDVVFTVNEASVSDLKKLSEELEKIVGYISKIIEKPLSLEVDYSSMKSLYEIGEDGASPIDKLKNSINGLQTGVLSDLKDAFKGFTVNETLAKRLEEVANSLKVLKESLNGIDPTSTDFLKTIKELSKEAKGLKDLATIIRASQEEIEKAKDVAKESNSSNTSDEGISKKLKKEKEEAAKVANSLEKDIVSLKGKLESSFKGTDIETKQFLDSLYEIAEGYAKIENYIREGTIKKEDVQGVYEYFSTFKNIIDEVSFKDFNTKGRPEEFIAKLKEAEIQLGSVKEALKKVESGEAFTDEDINKIKEFISQMRNLYDISGDKENKLARPISSQKLQEQIADILSKNTAMSKELRQEFILLSEEIKAAGNNLSLEKYNELNNRLWKLKTTMKETGQTGLSFFDGVAKRARSMSQSFISMYLSLWDIVRYVRTGLTYIKELDTAFTEMRKVSDESTQSLRRFQEASFDIASAVGTTAQQIQNSTADWMRLGESLNEASESARVSNILLNVSEFESIDEATESLVAMSSAYDELDKIDIIDKLNQVGNNFSISTDGLATALQKSASALTTAGNDMDEAVALVTAGNAVVQNPDSVGAGLRTIALRISGTESAREELEELGEDVSDFTVKTTAKSQQAIKDFTRVASNNFQGFDILDDNGNFKSTYDILLGISEIYEEIVETDKQYGSNMANGLLETLAGKNRANIAASILQNPQLLKDVYSSSQDSEGSAEKELEKYLDSIEGKIAQFQNEIQEFWYNLISSETIKTVIDFGTALIDILGKVTGALGEIGTLAVTAGAAFGIKAISDGGGRDKKFSLVIKYATESFSREVCEFWCISE